MEKYRFCKDCPDYRVCGRGYDLRSKRHHCGKALLPTRKKIVTNADRIRAKSDEELTKMIIKYATGHNVDICPEIRSSADCCKQETCVDCWIDWLKQEAE